MAKEEIIEKVKELKDSRSCYEGLKTLCEEYLASIGTEKEKELAETMKKALQEDVIDIDGSIAFLASEEGAAMLGKDMAEKMTAKAREAKEKGVKYCICPACTAGGWLLDHEDEY